MFDKKTLDRLLDNRVYIKPETFVLRQFGPDYGGDATKFLGEDDTWTDKEHAITFDNARDMKFVARKFWKEQDLLLIPVII